MSPLYSYDYTASSCVFPHVKIVLTTTVLVDLVLIGYGGVAICFRSREYLCRWLVGIMVVVRRWLAFDWGMSGFMVVAGDVEVWRVE
jgi:hypothetical protein